MKIKLDFTTWIKFVEAVNSSFFDAVNPVNEPKWEEMGIEYVYTDPNDNLAKHFDVVDKEKFFLSVIEHGIEFKELKFWWL